MEPVNAHDSGAPRPASQVSLGPRVRCTNCGLIQVRRCAGGPCCACGHTGLRPA